MTGVELVIDPLDVFSEADLAATEPEPVDWIVPGIIPVGLSILSGRPKIGKSWLLLDAARAVATGGEVLGVTCPKGDVLYLALEDNRRRLQRRAKKLRGGADPADRLFFCTDWSGTDEAGLNQLRTWLEDGERNVRLVIVDTLACAQQGPRPEEYSYLADYRLLRTLKQIADQYGIGLLVVQHQRKSNASDVFDTISGTTGLTGAADASFVLEKKRLLGRGRDLEGEVDLRLEFTSTTARWSVVGGAPENEVPLEWIGIP